MIRPKLSKFVVNEKGASMVEFAIIFPLLLLIIFGVIEWGLYMYNRQVITNAAREGARHGALMRMAPRDDVTADGEFIEDVAIRSKVMEYAGKNLITFGTDKLQADEQHILIERDPPNSFLFRTDLTVGIKYDYEFLIFYPLLSLLNSVADSGNGKLTIEVEATMKME